MEPTKNITFNFKGMSLTPGEGGEEDIYALLEYIHQRKPGAALVCRKLLDAFGEMGLYAELLDLLLHLKEKEIVGSDLYLLYYKICGENLWRILQVLSDGSAITRLQAYKESEQEG